MRVAGLPSLRVPALVACLVAVAALVAGCSTTARTSAKTASANAIVPSGGTLSIYLASPIGGAGGQAAADVLDAEKLAFGSAQRAGPYRLRMVVATGSEISAEAREAVSDKTTIAYLGEIEPGTSGVSAQITNELDILQVSPTDTAAYLTQPVSGVTGSPGHFYPDRSSYGETFSRIVPTSAVEAKALVARMQSEGVRTLAIRDDGSQYGATIGNEVRSDASAAGITTSAGTSGANALFYAGLSVGAAVDTFDQAVQASPSMKLYTSSSLYDDTLAGRLSPAAQKALTVSAPGFLASGLDAAGTSFVQSFQHAYGHAPAPQAVFGYEAMRAVIATLQGAGAQAAVRKTVVSDFRSLRRSSSDSALGAYSVNGGDTNLASFVFARVVNGTLVPRASG